MQPKIDIEEDSNVYTSKQSPNAGNRVQHHHHHHDHQQDQPSYINYYDHTQNLPKNSIK